MFKKGPLQKLLFVICFFLVTPKVFCQVQKPIEQDSSQYNTISQLLNTLEKTNSVHFYYNPDWFFGKKFPAALAKLPLEECLVRIKRLTGYSCLLMNDNTYVFVPAEINTYKITDGDKSSQIVVGNIGAFGKYSKANVTGKIIDGKTGNPLAGAFLIIDKQKIALTSEKDGKFSFVIPVGEYDVKLRYMGYEDDIKKIKFVGDGSINLELFEKSQRIDEVVISAEKADVNILGTQMSVVKLNSKAIKELPVLLGEKDIIKSFTLMPGIQSVGEFGSGFNVRGGSADQNLILVEDVPLFNTSHIFGLTSVINPDNVLDVTLLKAGIPAQYGERASSVMNIQMGTPNTNKFKVKGGIGLLNSRLTLETPIFKNKIFLQLGGRTSYSDWLLKQMPDLDLMNSSANFYDVNGLITYNLSNSDKLTFFSYLSTDKFSFSGTINYAYSNTLSSVKWNHFFNKKLSSMLLAGFSKYEYQQNELDTLNRLHGNKIKNAITYYKVKWNVNWIPSEMHNFNFGMDAIHYDINPGSRTPYGSQSRVLPLQLNNQKAVELSAYIGDNFNFNNKFTIEAGVRFTEYIVLGPTAVSQYASDYPRDTLTIQNLQTYANNAIVQKVPRLEPRFSFRYSLNDVSSIKLSYNRINQFINLISNTSVISPTDVWQLSNPNTKPLQCDQFAFGYFRNFNNNTYETSFEIYYKDLKHIIDYKDGSQILMNKYLELDLLDSKGYNFGTELYVKKNIGKLTGWISYTYSISRKRTTSPFEVEQVNQNQYYPSTYDRPHNLVINSNYHISRRWRFSGLFTYSTGRPETFPELTYPFKELQLVSWSPRNKYRLPDYHRLDISLTFDESLRLKRKWKGSWSLSIINVYGRKNAYSIFYKKDTPSISNNFQEFSLYKLIIIGKPFPSLTYNFIF